jgi:transposase-like protein
MAIMTLRSTYALDARTTQSIKRLARSWGVSQAEVIRRSVRLASEQKSAAALSPADVVAHYASNPLPRNQAQTKRLIESMRAMRHGDDTRRSRSGTT